VEWEVAVAALIPVYFIAALGMHAYDRVCLQNARQASARGAKSAVVAVGTMLLIAFTLQSSEELSRLIIVPGAVVAAIFIAICRYVFVKNLSVLVGGSPFSVILLWDGAAAFPQEGFSAIVEVGTDFDPEQHDPVMYDKFARAVAGADRIVVACAAECRPGWAHLLKSSNVQGEIFVPELMTMAPIGVSLHGRMPSVIVAVGPLGLTDRLIKRIFDIFVSMTALLMLAPLLVFISILIKLDSPGEVLFKQIRIGRRNEMFRIWKFRSMRMERGDEAGSRSASRGDDRITRIGSIIRRTSIDELPQLFNVLKGDMSIVGPRPHALGSRAAEKLFWEVDGRYWHRHSVKPGLTGLAQVRGFRGATIEESDLRNRLQADLEYLEDWSIWRDVKIILLTIRVLLHSNAY
jgi:exopolysaccharide biosynthesis polyprenyl glycosylphosphotransferase